MSESCLFDKMHFYNIINNDLNKLKGQIISIIGGGGKSTLLQKIGKELVAKNLKIILTTTTKMQPLPNVGLVLMNKNNKFDAELSVILDELKIALVANGYYKDNVLRGVNKYCVNELANFADIILIEADGSRQRSLKTHKEHEPVIPPISDTVIIICGANIVGEKLHEKTVHRAELFSQKWKVPLGTILTPEIISKELLSPFSYLKNIPIYAHIAFFINKSDTNLIGGKLLVEHLLQKCDYPVFWGSLKNNSLDRITLNNI